METKANEKSTGIMFKRALLLAYAMVTTPGKYLLEVLSPVTEANLVTNEEGKNPHYIVSLKAVAADKLAQLREAFGTSDEIEIEKTNGLFMTANIYTKPGVPTRLPLKGEKIEVIIDYVEDREKNRVLRAKQTQVREAQQAPTLDVASFFETAEAKKDLVHAK